MAAVLTKSMRVRGIAAAMACTTAAALGLGGLLPLLSITLERFQIPGYLIGINAMMPFVSALIIMPFLPKIMARFQTAPLLFLCVILSCVMTLSYGLFIDFTIWFPLRFLNGLALGVLFAVSEAWINHFSEERYRGRIIAIYATLLSAGFACGPLILAVAGTEGLAPYLLCSVLILIASLPLFGAWGLPQAFRDDEEEEEAHHEHFQRFFFLAPTLMLAGMIYGAAEGGVITFMPIYGIRLGFSEEIAAAALTAFSLGNILCQIPIGILADKYPRMRILLTCAAIATLSAITMPFLISFSPDPNSPLLLIGLAFLLFIFGAVVVALYTLALIMVGERFRGVDLAGANAALVFCYNLGNLITPPAAGAIMDGVPNFGLPFLLAAITGTLLLRPLWRGFIKKRSKNEA